MTGGMDLAADEALIKPFIRAAGTRDVEDLVRLAAELGYRTDSDAMAAELLHPSTARVLVAVVDGSIVGLVAFDIWRSFVPPGSVCRISALAVHSHCRGRGVAGALISAAEERARSAGAGLIELSCGRRPERAAAHRLYQRRGYRDRARDHASYLKVLN